MKFLHFFARWATLLVLTCASAKASLVAYWPFNDAPTLGNDGVGGTVLTTGGATFTATGKFGGGLALNGTSQYLGGTVNNLPIGNSTYSQCAWFKPSVLGARGIVGWGNYGAARQVNALRIFDSGNAFRHYWWGADLDSPNSATNFLDGNWHHVATTYDGTNRRIYLDGVQVAADVPGTNAATAVNFRIGSTNNGEYFSGTLDEVAIYNNALSATQVQSLAAGGSHLAGPIITSFTTNKPTAYEGDAVALSWTVNTASVTGTYTYEIKVGATTVSSGTAPSGTFNTTVPDLAGNAQTITWTFRAIETGGANVTNSATVSVAADPGIPSANSQAGLSTAANTPLNITLTDSDPNGGTLSYIIVTPPARGSLNAGPGAVRTYTPTTGVYGPDQFTFKVSDGKYESPVATVRLTVITPPQPPTSIALDDQTIRSEAVAGDFLANLLCDDLNVGEAHTYTLVSGFGDTDNARFSIVGHQLRAATAFASLVGITQRIRVRCTDAAGLSIEVGLQLSVAARTRHVVINEIHYNGSNSTVRNSFVEIYNDTSATVDLGGWRLSGALDYLFSTGTTLASGGYLVVAEDPATILSTWGKTALGPWVNALVTYPDGSKETNNLSNDGGTIRLRNAANQTVSQVDYDNHSPWPSEGNGEGSSIELINPALDEEHGSNWRAAKSGGTAIPVTTYIPFASTWRWRKGVVGDTGEPTTPFTAWRQLNFVEPALPAANAQWQNGTTPIGYGENDGIAGTTENTTLLTDMLNSYSSVYMRKTFTIPTGQLPSALQIQTRCDDGCIVWINGIYVGASRPNAAILTGHHYYNTLAQNAPEPAPTETFPIIPAAAVNLVEGLNVITIHAMNTTLGSSDFFIDLQLKQAILSNDVASPTAQNIRYAATAAPAVRNVEHTPKAPTSADPILITAKISDPQGVASASLAYQINTPGNFIPSTLPKAISGGNFVNVAAPLDPNPAFEAAANWITLAMNDDGVGDDARGGDGVWTATIPPQINRSLVRYRITVTDNPGASARVPYPADPALNFACYVYNGVPDYAGSTATALQTLPVYHLLTRKTDYDQCVAYDPANRLSAGLSWNFENWEAAFVYDGVVYDHIPYRLKGANGRYVASGTGGAGNAKRAFKFYFNKGYELQARDQAGEKYPTTWSTMITENLWENRASYTFSLNEAVDFHLFNQLGVPAPRSHWSHFRTVMQPAEQPDLYHGDFWGLMWVHEDYDRRFLQSHNLKKGNLYKLTRDGVSGITQFRYQSSLGVTDGSDHADIYNNLKGTSTPAFITGRVNLDLWCRYHAFCEAIRHYDYWPNGDNNSAYYFYPNYNTSNGNKGQLWYLPNDLDATWGPTWSNGQDIVHNALFNDAASSGGDASTNLSLWPNYFNQVHEIRTLLWQPDQVNPLIDQFAATIRPFVNAEFKRWYGAPADAGNFDGLFGPNNTALNSVGQTALDLYVAGMKDFAFDADNNGGVWPGGDVGAGGRAAFMDTLGVALGESSALYPVTPAIAFAGTSGFPINDLRFTSNAFSDPQGAGTFAAMQWRMAAVNTSGTYVPTEPRLLEIIASHDSGELTTFNNTYKFPPTACEPGKRYRARVRMKDNTGRWSNWSTAAEFTAGSFDPSAFSSQIVITEIMYNATAPTAAERALAAALSPAQVWVDDSFDYVELRNLSATPLDLTGFQFTAGFSFTFPTGYILAPGAFTLVVANVDAFNARYGTGKPVAGAWSASDRLNNAGETITLQYGQALPPVFVIAYDDDNSQGWPQSPDGDGPSLVRISPERLLPNSPMEWRSGAPSPGTDDRINFTTWLGSTPTGDPDKDGLDNLVEYALGGDAMKDSSHLIPTATYQSYVTGSGLGTYATLAFQRDVLHEDFTQQVEFSTNLTTWPITAEKVSSLDHGNGTRTEVWRSSSPVENNTRIFGRVRFTQP